MPFKSEKQRKYLWANEPGIARDWTDKYGSRVKKVNGGVMDIINKYIGPNEAHMYDWGLARSAKNKPWSNTPEYHQWGAENLATHGAENWNNLFPGLGEAFKRTAPFIAGATSPIYDIPQGISRYYKKPWEYETNNKWDKINAYFPDLQGTTVSGILNAIDKEDPLSAAYNRMIGAAQPWIKDKFINRPNQIKELFGKGWDAIKNEFGGSAQAAEASMKGWEKEENDRKMRTKMNEQKIAFENQFGGGSWKDRHALAKRAMTQPKEVLEWKSLDPDFDKLPEALQDLMGGERFRATTKWTDPYGPYKYTPAETNVASANKSTTSGINGRNGLAKNWSVFDDLEAQNIRPTFDSSDEEQDYYNQIRNKIGKMPTIKDPNIFQRFRNNFYKPATSAAGGYNVSQLNQMNALGGYYSEPARQQRRMDARRTNILNRAAKGKAVGNVNQLLGKYGYTGTPGSGTLQFTGQAQGDPNAGAGYSRSDDSWSSSPFRRGGLASLWQR